MDWTEFLTQQAVYHRLTEEEQEALLARMRDNKNETQMAISLNLTKAAVKKRMGEVYKKFEKSCQELKSKGPGKAQKLRSWLKLKHSQNKSLNLAESFDVNSVETDWKNICYNFFQHYKELTTNDYVCADGAMRNLDEIYVPLGLVERRKRESREGNVGAERGSQFYAPEEYELTQKYDRHRFFNEVLQEGKTEKSQGKRLAIIGEPGAGKTTFLQKIGDWVFGETDEVAIWVPLAAVGEKSLRDYLLEVWLRDARGMVTAPPPEWQSAFAELLKSGKVWLLLDGVDEMSASTPLSQIASQLKGWACGLRVVVSCRLNVWDADKNALFDFDTYRSLEFGYPDEVGRFIDKWFALVIASETKQSPKSDRHPNNLARRLKQQLEEPGKERIRDLIKNPLRLTLLCRTWQRWEGLPDTQAQLYGRFVEDFYLWKEEEFPTTVEGRRRLNQMLGELARRAIDRESSRFRLSHRLVCEVLGEGSEWFELAMRLGWLNKVGVAAENPDELVYAFYHPTFQEYFAALSIGDWRFFLPENVAAGSYRIFESQWKQVILLWLGRKDLEKQEKEEFIGALVNFEDETGRDFYGFRALFLAAAGIAEFKGCSRADEIVGQVVKVGFGFYSEEQEKWLTWPDEATRAAREALRETERGRASSVLVELIRNSQSYDTRRQAVRSLGLIGQGNDTAIAALVELIGNSQSKDIRREAARSLGEIRQGNDTAIVALVELIGNSQSKDIRREVARSLEKIGQGNDTAIAALVELIRNSQSEIIREQAASSLGKIGQGNDTAIAALVELIRNSQSEDTCRRAINSLREIGKGNDTVIAALVELISNFQSERIRAQAAESLGFIDPGNETAIAALIELISNSQSERIRAQALESLGEIGQGNDTVIHVFVQLIKNTQSEYVCGKILWSLRRIGQGNDTAIAAVVELIGTSQSGGILRQAAQCLGEIAKGNDTAINALVELIRNTQTEYTIQQTASNLVKIAPSNDIAIASLIRLIDNFQSGGIPEQAAQSLGLIEPGNNRAIAALVELIINAKSEVTRCQAAWSLERVSQGNETAIAALIELIGNTQSEDIGWLAASSLGKIGKGNDTAIAALVELIGNTQSEDTRMQALSSLQEIGKSNDTAIAALVELIGNTQSEEIRMQVAESLGFIDPGNKTAINVLVELIGKTQYECTFRLAWSLGKIATEPQIPKVVSALKNHLSDETYKNDRRLFNECYEIIWNYAQTLPYQKFHQAWHRDNTPTTQMQEKQLANICTQLQHLPLWCIDADILGNETTEEAIAQTLCELISTAIDPDTDYPEVNNAAQLRKYLRFLAKQQKPLVILIHNCEPEEAIALFCRKLTNIARIIWITDAPVEPPIKAFSPGHPNLVEAVESWLEELMLWNGE